MNLKVDINKAPTDDLWGIGNFLPKIKVLEIANYKKKIRNAK